MKIVDWFKTLRRYFEILTADISLYDMEYMIKREGPSVFQFYNQGNANPDKKRNRFFQTLSLIKNLFLGFILKMNPTNRWIYILSVYLVIAGLLENHDLTVLTGFIFLNIMLAFEMAGKIMAKDELEIARDIQMQLLPEAPPNLKRYDISFFSEAAREVGGDFLDFIHNGEKLTTVIGDISGKGMRAAIHMVQVHTIINSLKSTSGTHEFLTQLNDRLEGVLPKSVFVTTSFLCMNGNDTVEFYRSGHLPMFKYDSKTQNCESIVPPGLGIGLASTEKYEKSLKCEKLNINTGDVFLLFTDGLVETMDSVQNEYGEDRLMQVLCENATLTSKEIQDAILKSVALFRGNQAPHDDLTLVIIKCV